MIKQNKERLNADAKKMLLADLKLAGKIINELGGKMTLPTYVKMIYRSSPRLTKNKTVLKIISKHTGIGTDQLVSKVENGNEKSK